MKFTNHHISDLVIRIKNAVQRKHKTVVVPNVRIVSSVLDILFKEGYVQKYEIQSRSIVVHLKYEKDNSVITDFIVSSKPSVRVYKKANQVPCFYNGLGVSIVSTSKGVVSDAQAREIGVGGEVLCQIF